MDKELFIKMYKEFGNLKDTCNYLHISQEKVQKIRKVDDEFDAACRRTTIENYKKSKVPEGKREKQMKVFLEAYKSGKNFMASLKESGITTHAFQEIKKTGFDLPDSFFFVRLFGEEVICVLIVAFGINIHQLSFVQVPVFCYFSQHRILHR